MTATQCRAMSGVMAQVLSQAPSTGRVADLDKEQVELLNKIKLQKVAAGW